ncbi:MAG: PorT family protein [Salinivirgaceae bacterium]|nr:PorT family protein [Salinivirgaceae bacterium]
MKKATNLTVIICILFAFTANAQSMKYGVKGAYTHSSVYVQDESFSSYRPGFGIGGFFQYDVLDILGVSIEPMFVKKGGRDSDYTTYYDEKSTLFVDQTGKPFNFESQNLDLSVIEVPILAQYITEVAGFDSRVFAGPSFDFLLKANYLRNRIFEDEEILTSEDISDRFKSMDVGFMAGVGYNMEISMLILRVDFTYRYGVTNFNNVENKPAVYNNNFALTVGIGLGN